MPNKRGYVVSKSCGLFLFIGFIGSLTAVGLLVYFLADRPFPHAGSEAASSTAAAAKPTPPKLVKNVRLPRSVLPRHYDVRLFPILEVGNFTILGQVSIDVECNSDTDRIILHSQDIIVDPKTVQVTEHGKTDNAVLMVDAIEYDKEMEFLIVKLCPKHKTKLNKGRNYTVSMNFVGNLTDQLKGLYRSSYTEDGVEKWMAVSQMEPTDARRAFPCFDEPNMKATFTVTLGRHRDMISISNMPLINTTAMEGMEGFFWDKFDKSVPMSTYLVAFVVANFTRVEADTSKANWKFNIYSRPSASNQTEYARSIGPKIQAFFEDYFAVPFPLPKQDMIAIPDFSAGAMENWGLITYRETALLFDEKLSSVSNKERVVSVVAHELAHQWFGNLVTMDWWTDLWLNEGFASYIEYIGSEHVEPNFKWLQMIVTEDVQDVMGLDALESSHPISQIVHHPSEINELFDRISYGKGATIIRMLASFIGEKTFREGLTNYLKSRQYGNAVQDDLWEAFTQQAKVNKISLPATVKQIMDSWTLKMGYPVVTVQRNYQARDVIISQERFLMQKSNGSSEDKTVYQWWVPLTYTTNFKTIGSTWLAENEKSKVYPLEVDLTNNQWIIFNVDETGYFRVNYDLRNWQLLTRQMMNDYAQISVVNRAQIMDDALNLAEAGVLDYEIALNLTQYLEKEEEYLPWDSALNSLSFIRSMMSRTSGYGLFKKHIKKIITPLYNSLGFNQRIDDSPLTVKLRTNAVNWACFVNNKDCSRNAVQSYARWMADPDNLEIISPNLKRTILCTAIREGGEEEWDFAFSRYLKSNVAAEKATLLSALSCSQESWILGRLLEMSLNTTSGIRKQDAWSVISQVAGNSLGRYLAFNFVRNRWDDLRAAFTTFSSLSRIIRSVSMSFNTELELKELLQFKDNHQELLSNAARSTQQSIDRAKNNLNWMQKNYQKVVDWLERNYAN